MLYRVEETIADGRPLAGVLCFINGGVLAAQSVYYPDPSEMPGIRLKFNLGGSYSGIEFAKIVMVALADVAKGLGLSFLDTEMVSNLTANLKAKYVTVEDFFEMSRIEAPKNVTKSDFLSQTWNP